MPSISLCLIALNEADELPEAIENTRPFVDEIVLVDGGSTDGTVAIAVAAGARVIHRPWADHFADQRNVGLAAAKGDWIFVMDPDERPEPKLLHQLRSLASEAGPAQAAYDMVGFPRRNLIDGVQTSAYPDIQWRLFPRTDRIRFYGRLHERPLGWTRMLVVADAHILHAKSSERQQTQNERYERIKRIYGIEDQWQRSLSDPMSYEAPSNRPSRSDV